MSKSFVVENAYFWTSYSSFYSFGRSHLFLRTGLITFTLSSLKVLSYKTSMVSGLRKHGGAAVRVPKIEHGGGLHVGFILN